MKLSLVTTAYNETKIIKKTILAWSKWLNKQNIKFVKYLIMVSKEEILYMLMMLPRLLFWL